MTHVQICIFPTLKSFSFGICRTANTIFVAPIKPAIEILLRPVRLCRVERQLYNVALMSLIVNHRKKYAHLYHICGLDKGIIFYLLASLMIGNPNI